jgi:hypothetical protein
MLKKYTFRDDHGAGNFQISLALDTDQMPICFDTFMDWVEARIDTKYRHISLKLVHEEEFTEGE